MRRSGGAVTVAGRAERVDDEAGAADSGRWTVDVGGEWRRRRVGELGGLMVMGVW